MRYHYQHQTIATLLAAILFAQAAVLRSTAQVNLPVGVRIDNKLSSPADWSKALVESTMQRYPTAESLKGWGYAKSLYLYGVYLVYLRTKDPRYLEHIKSWIDLHIDDKGTINRPINALDYMLPGNLLLILYKETKQQKYKLAADSIRKTFDTYPRTKDGGFWHATNTGNGSCGPMGSSCRCRFWHVMVRCSATARMQTMKLRNSCSSIIST